MAAIKGCSNSAHIRRDPRVSRKPIGRGGRRSDGSGDHASEALNSEEMDCFTIVEFFLVFYKVVME